MKTKTTPEQEIIFAIGRGIRAVFRLLFGVKKGAIKASGVDRALVNRKWSEIGEMVKMGGESRLRSAVVEADKLLDYALKGKGYTGENMGERLKSAINSLTREGYNAAWEAHKLRNRMVHEIEHEVFSWEVEKALKNFEKALRELRVL